MGHAISCYRFHKGIPSSIARVPPPQTPTTKDKGGGGEQKKNQQKEEKEGGGGRLKKTGWGWGGKERGNPNGNLHNKQSPVTAGDPERYVPFLGNRFTLFLKGQREVR